VKKSSETGIFQIQNYFSSMLTHREGQCGKTEFFLNSPGVLTPTNRLPISHSSVKRKIRWMIVRFVESTCLLLLIGMSPTVVRILHINDIEIYSHHTMISHISERIIDCKYFFCELAISLNQHKGLQLGSVMALASKSFLTSVLIIS
jgi:hypothetical protein